jgi:nitrogen regulatory protein PII
MKFISGIVSPSKVESVKQALDRARVYSLKVAAVHNHAPQADRLCRFSFLDRGSAPRWHLRAVRVMDIRTGRADVS